MRTINRLVLTFCLGMAIFGCGKPTGEFEGPKVDAFHGKLTHNGKPVKFAENEEVSLSVFHETGRQFGIPLTADGTFEIGWMPIGKYSMMLERTPHNVKKGATKTRYGVPGSLIIEAGKTDYDIDLGKNFKP
jgi:hypothetical protein